MDRMYGTRLRTVRQERGLRQVDIAASLEMSAGGYSSIERGKARIFLADLPRYADALGVAPAYLTRRLGLCDDDSPDIANVLVNRFGPRLGQTLVRQDRVLAVMEQGDEVALDVVLANTVGKYEPARES